MEIDLSEKLRMLEEEVDKELEKKNTEKIIGDLPTSAVKSNIPVTDEVILKEDFPDTDKWSVTLAGGGGKGSYQIGAWKALMEIGVWDRVLAVSGASVGALNAALMGLGDYDNAVKIWKNILPNQFLDLRDSVVTAPLISLFESGRDGFCSRDGLIDILDNKIDISALATPKVDVYACIAGYSSAEADVLVEKPYAEYIRLCEVSREEAKKVLLASSAMPYVYPPETIYGKVYRDGGLANNCPVEPLVPLEAKKLIVIRLSKETKVDRNLYSDFDDVVEITPSKDIGDLIDGTLDFGNQNVMYRMLLGYYDTLRAFSLRMYEKNGLPLDPAEVKRREEADYEKIMSELSRERALASANKHMDAINSIFTKFGDL